MCPGKQLAFSPVVLTLTLSLAALGALGLWLRRQRVRAHGQQRPQIDAPETTPSWDEAKSVTVATGTRGPRGRGLELVVAAHSLT